MTHGSPVNFSGKLYNVVDYGVNADDELIDYEALRERAHEVKPTMIVAGASAYPRVLDFEKFREIADEVGAYLLVDMRISQVSLPLACIQTQFHMRIL